VCNRSSNHLDNISGIRTRAIEIVNVFETEFFWEKDIQINTIFEILVFHDRLTSYFYSGYSGSDVILNSVDIGQHFWPIARALPIADNNCIYLPDTPNFYNQTFTCHNLHSSIYRVPVDTFSGEGLSGFC
jgi:hypothetical protein